MTMTISAEIRKAVEEAGEQPLEIIDPETQQRYMLLKADVFERLSMVLHGGVLSKEEQKYLLEQAGRRAGWDDPEMDIYDDLATPDA
jgi:hypothetical protein